MVKTIIKTEVNGLEICIKKNNFNEYHVFYELQHNVFDDWMSAYEDYESNVLHALDCNGMNY
jgi:hypothetical protein